ncbi:MAG: NAD(P)-dependent oxidoreductase [Nitrospirales bacterium]|nr:MAG: NAD(P)-dependent oxidoreductase [Nitrospirales bacterium]
MKVVVVGADGQLGHALQQSLNVHDLSAYGKNAWDITDRELTRQKLETAMPDVVINAAAYTNVDQAESDTDSAYRVNADGPHNLALATDALNIPLVHISTDYVFDGTQTEPYHEYDRPNPRSIYGKSKLAGEERVRTTAKRHFIIRTAWLYHTVGRNFPNTICALAHTSPVRVVNDQFGSPTYAPHLANGIGQLLQTCAYGTYHLAGSGGTSWFDFTKELFAQLQIRTPITPVSTKEFPRPAPRPASAILTSLQNPCILLPPWKQGVSEFALHYSSSSQKTSMGYHDVSKRAT